MNQTGDIAANLLKNPPDELQGLMADPRTTHQAREAVASVMESPQSSSGNGIANGHHSLNKPGDGRLQVVNEHQEFTYIFPSIHGHELS